MSRAAAAGAVVIRSEFAGVNFADLWTRLDPDGEPGVVPGIEVAGRVHSLGADVDAFSVGDRVVGLPYFAHGGYAEYVEVPATHVFPVPDEIALDVAAAIPLNYLTAYIALARVAQVRRGDESSFTLPPAESGSPRFNSPPQRARGSSRPRRRRSTRS